MKAVSKLGVRRSTVELGIAVEYEVAVDNLEAATKVLPPPRFHVLNTTLVVLCARGTQHDSEYLCAGEQHDSEYLCAGGEQHD